jgi:hypothetical protein
MMTTAPDIMQLVNLAVGLMLPLLSGVCAVLCFVHRRLSSRLMLLGAGFLLECIIGLVNRLGVFAFNYFIGPSLGVRFDVFFFVMLVGYVLAFTLIVMGLALSLGDIARRMRRMEYEAGDPRSRFGAEDPREPWQPRTEGSRDIQR